MSLVDRLITITITAVLTSALWIVAGGTLIANSTAESQIDVTRPAEAAPSPAPTPSDEADAVAGLETVAPDLPSQAKQAALMIPVLNIRASDLTDTFTDERGGGSRFHEAIDIMAPRGTSVLAAAPGTIEKLFISDAGGKTIYVRSGDGETIYYYAHLDEYAPGLTEGQRVRRGQRLGTVGSTGNAADKAPHLHFSIMRTTADAEWWEPATAINPYPILVAG